MAVIAHAFDSYRIWYFSRHPSFKALVNCYLGQNNASVGTIIFYDATQFNPENRITGGNPVLYYPFECFNDVVGVLRNEKPLTIYLTEETGFGAVTTTDREPTGELEPTT